MYLPFVPPQCRCNYKCFVKICSKGVEKENTSKYNKYLYYTVHKE